jgi:HlyD family secretion protein
MKRRLPLLLLVLLVLGVTVWWWSARRDDDDGQVLRLTGTVEATDTRLAFETGGRIARLTVREGDTVAAGSEVATLDDAELTARREQAAAQLAAAQARLAELESGARPEEVTQAEAERTAAAERLADAERELERTRLLTSGGAAPREALDKAELGRELAAARLDQTSAALHLVRRGARDEQLAAQRAVVAQAQAGLEAAKVASGRTVLAAPFAGLVTVRHREPGEVVAPGAPVLTLLDRDDRWVRLFVPEDRLGAVRLGAAAILRSDTYPGKTYRGEVVHLADEAEFTPKNVQTAEERVLLVYAAKVRVLGDPGYELKPGMPVDVEIPLAPAR